MKNIKFLILGLLFGFMLLKAEVVSWYRIQEMFYFHDFHMYGVIGSAVVTGIISVLIIKRFKIKALDGSTINIPKKKHTKGNIIGGLLFGFGWAVTGACPGPLFSLFGYGYSLFIIPILSAILGVYVYALIKDKLPQ